MDHVETIDLFSYRERYDYTAFLSRRDWAYEYLRRVPAFEADAWRVSQEAISERLACHDITVLRMRHPQPEAEAWGLKFFPNPGVPAPRAPVFWTDTAHSEKVSIAVQDADPEEVDLTFEETIRKCRMMHLTDCEGREHLVINGNGCSVQVACTGKSLLTADPVKTVFTVNGFENIDYHTEILRQSKRVYGDQLSEAPSFTRKARLLRNGLIAFDGKRAGLTDRQIAWIIDGRDVVENGCAKGDRSLIRRVATYRDNAMALCDGGYRDFLVPKQSPAEAA